MTDIILIYVTCPSLEVAQELSRTIITEKLAACANIGAGIRSVYHWEGKIEESHEIPVLFKTVAALAAPLTARIAALHPYDCPCIITLPVTGGYAPFLQWVAAETTSNPQ